jgi:hypothetical protein
MILSDEDINVIETRAKYITRNDSILQIPNNLYGDRNIFYFEGTGLYYVLYTVNDQITEVCHFTDGESFTKLSKAEEYYDSILNLVDGKVYISGRQ